MVRWGLLAAGSATLAAVWLGPLPGLAPRHFSAHMTMHMAVVAVAAPLVALALAGSRFDPVRPVPAVFNAVPASIAELVVVWSWHAPALHHLARASTAGLVLEQAMFFSTAFVVWMSAFGGEGGRMRSRAGTGVVALLLTSMHMTLLGALILLAPRPLYGHTAGFPPPSIALHEQHVGGAIMLLVGGASYLAGGLWLAAGLVSGLSRRSASGPREDTA